MGIDFHFSVALIQPTAVTKGTQFYYGTGGEPELKSPFTNKC